MTKSEIRVMRRTLRYAFVIVLFLGFLYPLGSNAGPKFQPKAEIAWTEVKNGTNHIFYSALVDDHNWLSKLQVSKSDTLNVAPAISSGGDGRTWVVWSAVEGVSSQLVFCSFDGENWSEPKELSSHLSSNVGSSIAVDRENTLWIVWVGFDGVDDDIYFTRLKDNIWDTPLRINADNDVPDIDPTIVIGVDNIPTVYWNGYDGDTYSRYVSTWTGTGWVKKEVIERRTYNTFLLNEAEAVPELPEFINESHETSIHIRMKKGLQSIPLSEIKSN